MSLVVKDKGLASLFARLKTSKRTISVGIHAPEGAQPEPGGATVADVATWNHFGTDRIPARPFITGWVDAHGEELKGWLKTAGEKIVKGMDPYAALEPVALRAEGGVKKYISEGVPPPNAASTIERKGSSKPLINTGQLRSSVRGRVT